MPIASVPPPSHDPHRTPPQGLAPASSREGAHAPSGAHGHAHAHGHPHGHSHGPGRRHPPARPSASLLRLSVWQRLAMAVPLAALLWAAALWVIGGVGA
ncbi:hypothetical protein [Ancylobacter mangrovi]|uniref:hypothetical protein n=1 Tax=Ancylobacter mangrovi TaxID=2972472 RepID=UPI0021625042|nr:hypothetical protein [Ancylobacter mangrovi]MCS0504017.1 hypothetical protein [Ancylobacter mangrovi]